MKIFVDSSILIEYEKQAQTELFEALVAEGHQLYINPIVVSEYLYHLIAIRGAKSPLTIRENGKIAETLTGHDTAEFLSSVAYLPIPADAVPLCIELIKRHNLLPNDALILATCKLQSIAILASYDSDFTSACHIESITLISNISDLKNTHSP
jgi:predicted nucleic acid-binding protein